MHPLKVEKWITEDIGVISLNEPKDLSPEGWDKKTQGIENEDTLLTLQKSNEQANLIQICGKPLKDLPLSAINFTLLWIYIIFLVSLAIYQ